MKLMVAVPTLDMIHWEFARCLTGLVQRLERSGVEYDVCFKGGTLVYNAREALAAEAINSGYTHILWLDADMVFNPDVFDTLSAHEKPFVTGVYRSRHAPYKSCIFKSLDPDERFNEMPDELFEICACGFGIVLTETAVLYEVYKANGTMFLPNGDYGEDIALCDRARKLGYTLYCDPGVRAGHIGFVTVWVKE